MEVPDFVIRFRTAPFRNIRQFCWQANNSYDEFESTVFKRSTKLFVIHNRSASHFAIRTLAHFFPLISFPELRIQDIPEAFSEKVEGEDHDEDGDAGNECEPGCIKYETLAVRENIAPRGMRGRDTESEETQASLG